MSRRRYLSLAGAAVGGITTADAATAQETTSAPGADEESDELQAKCRRLEERRSELESVRADSSALASEISEQRREKRFERTRYPEDVRERARQAGLDARPKLVTVRIQERRLLGWVLDAQYVVTHTLTLEFMGVNPEATAEVTLADGHSVSAELVDRTGSEAPGIALWRADTGLSGLSHADVGALDPGDELVGVTSVPGRERVITLGELRRRVDGSPASLASSVPAYGIQGGIVLNLDGEIVGTIYGTGPERIEGLPDYLEGPVQTEALPWLSEYRHVPVDTVVETTEPWR